MIRWAQPRWINVNQGACMAILSQARAEDSNTPTGWQATATQLHRVASETAGNLRAFVSIAITPPGAAGGLTLHGVRIIAPPGKPPYVSLPQQQRGDRYYPILTTDDEGLKAAIRSAALGAYRDAVALGIGFGGGQ
jgi:DNA-binding cell septation regulator SpoVG